MKTMALRLRSTKTELEEMGEDAEGAAENVSKLREQMLALTGVDIQLDDTTYKSTYQILLEISKVWDRLDDLSRSSVLEQLFGKRQANIGAAILENGRLLERVYETSEKSAGSAWREQEEYAKSVQYALDRLKASYQEFAQEVVGSDLVKSGVNTAKAFLEILTTIVKTFGALPPIIATISTVMGVKGRGIFQAEGLQSFSQALSQVKTNLATIASYGTIKNLYSQRDINLNGISKEDIGSLQKYVDLLNRGEDEFVAFNTTMQDASVEAKALTSGFNSLNAAYKAGTISEKEYKAATQSLATVQKTATATSKALSIALNTIANVGIMIAITAAIKGVSALADKLIVTKEELATLREEALQDMDALSNGIKDLTKKEEDVQDLVNKYKELITSTSDVSQYKDELLKIQDNIIDKFGEEKDSLDLLNDTYDVTISKIKELTDAQYQEWKTANADKIARAEKLSGYNLRFYTPEQDRNFERLIESQGFAEQGGQKIFFKDKIKKVDDLAASLYVLEDVSESIEKYWTDIDGIDFTDGLFSNTLYLSGTIEEAQTELSNLIATMQKSGATDKELEPLVKRYNELGQAIQTVGEYLQQKNQYESDYIESINDVSTKSLHLLRQTSETADEARAKWFKNLEEIQKATIKNVDEMKSALQSVADGDLLSSDQFWKLLEFDTQGVLSGAKLIGDQFKVSEEQLIRLKDTYIRSQIKSLEIENDTLKTQMQETQELINQAKVEIQALGRRGLSNAAYRKEYQEALQLVVDSENRVKELGNQWQRNRILIAQYNSNLGDTVDRTKQLQEQQKKLQSEIDDLNKEADKLLKAQEYRIDRVIDGHKEELDALNAEKEALQNELDALNKQKEAIEDIIDNYETVNSLVQNTVQKEIDALEEQKKEIEDSYNKRIEALKAENKEREDALEYAQKLKNLENAKNNKTRVYDEARGWHYASNQDDIKQAQNELAEYETNKAIEALEAERDALVEATEDLIDNKEKYAEQWKDISEQMQEEADEELAKEILGADWRDKITKGDMKLLSDFITKYRAHNSSLKTLTNTEIALKNQAIEAKEAEIDAKNKQIESWEKYKTDVQNAAKEIQNANEDYLDIVRQLDAEEPLTLENRANAFENFKNRLSGYIDEIGNKQAIIDQITTTIEQLNGGVYEFDLRVDGLSDLEEAATVAEKTAKSMAAATAFAKQMAKPNVNQSVQELGNDVVDGVLGIFDRLGFAQGGTVDYTGLAMVHGSKKHSETVFNAADSQKLYNYVHNTPDLMAAMMQDTLKKTSATNAVPSVSIGTINVTANNPQELARGLDKTLDRYFRTKLTESYAQH